MASITSGTTLRRIHRLFREGTASGQSDAQLFERFLAGGDAEAFEVLVARHGPMVLGVCRAILKDPHDVEDAFQATFLVLVKKGTAIRGHDALAGWLHRVAHRVAVQANREAARRRGLEREAVAPEADVDLVAGDATSRSLHAALHEEVARLPEKCRLAIVHCYLEGKTHAQAAEALHWGEATVRRRLADARDLLKSRLTRRGLAPAVGLFVSLEAGTVSAAIPESWIRSTARTAIDLATRPATHATLESTAATALAEAVLKGLAAARIKLAGTTVLALGMLTAISVSVIPRPAGGEDLPEIKAHPRPKPRPQVAVEEPRKGDPDEPKAYAGRVVDPKGNPVAKAKLVLWINRREGPNGPPARATSAADGRFRFDVPISDFDTNYENKIWENSHILAFAQGYGLGVGKRGGSEGGSDITLVEDLPVSGRVIDLQGRPIPGVTIRPVSLRGTEGEDLTPCLAPYLDRESVVKTREKEQYSAMIPEVTVAPAVTDAEGRFRLTGLGRERLVYAMAEGPTIETAAFFIMTRHTPTIRAKESGGRTTILYGAEFEHVAGPSQPVVGVVRDQDTGAPIAGVEVQGNHPPGSVNHIRALTDHEGRYRLDGLPAAPEVRISAVAPVNEPYLRTSRTVKNPPSETPTDVSFTMARGVWIKGRVTDRATRRPVRGHISYFAFRENPDSTRLRGSTSDGQQELRWTAADGSYRVVGVPGRGIVAFRAHADDDYGFSVGAKSIAGSRHPSGFFETRPQDCYPSNFHILAAVNPSPTGEATCDLEADPGRTVKVTAVDPDDAPLSGTIVLGKGNAWTLLPLEPEATAEFEVIRLGEGEERTLTMLHEGRKLSAGLVIRGGEATPLRVTLKPWGVVTGRLVDARGEPRGNLAVNGMDIPKYDPETGGIGPKVFAGDDGRFRIEGLVAGRSYTFRASKKQYGLGVLVRDLTLQPGESRDLGDVQAKEEP